MSQLIIATKEDGSPEIFRSIQGEGATAGQLRTFIRLSGCNLHCRWCDTAYSWNWSDSDFMHEADKPGRPHKFDPNRNRVMLQFAEIAQAVLDLPSGGLVITGGEPLLQQKKLAAFLKQLMPKLASVGFSAAYVEMESNGTIFPSPELAEFVTQWNISPKLDHSGNDPKLALKEKTLRWYGKTKNCWFKFVVRAVADIENVKKIAEKYELPAERILLMPEGATSAQLRARQKQLLPAVMKSGFGFSDRLHLHLFGSGRGI